MNGDLYVDICKDVERRIREHQAGKNRYTKGLRPWILMLWKSFETGQLQDKKKNIIRAE